MEELLKSIAEENGWIFRNDYYYKLGLGKTCCCIISNDSKEMLKICKKNKLESKVEYRGKDVILYFPVD